MRVYIARQAIYDKFERVFAYELLYRNGEKNAYDTSIDGDKATRSLLSHIFMIFDLPTLTDGRPAFINFTENLLHQELSYILDPREVVIEILEDVPATKENIETIINLKDQGYRLSLDDYTGDPSYDVMLPYVDIVKVDFMQVPGDGRLRLAKRLKRQGIQILAEKVETEEDYNEAVKAGYDFFQGYYFEKPILFKKNSAGILTSTQYRVLRELNRSTFCYENLEKIIRLDVNLSYKILHRANTLEYYRGIRITKLKDALVRMGIYELRHWMTLLFFSDFVSKKEESIIRLALIRGMFAEKVAWEMGELDLCEDAFTVGMFSLIDVLFNDDMDTLLNDICLGHDAEEALRGKKNLLRDILDFSITYGQGHWNEAAEILGERVDMAKTANYYYDAIQYSNEVYHENGVIREELREKEGVKLSTHGYSLPEE